MQTFRDVIALWPSPEIMAQEIAAKPATVRKWATRNSIPADRWQPIIEAACARGKTVTAADLARLAAKPAQESTAA